MKALKSLLTLCILPLVMVSCTAVKQTVAVRKAQKETKESLENAVKVDFVAGMNLEKDQFSVNVTPKKIQELSIKPHANGFSNGFNPMAIASRSFNAMEAIRMGKMINFPLYSFIEEWYGTPYRLGGTTKRGIDCSAFVRELYANVYHTGLLRTAMEQFSSSMRLFSSQLKEGDLVFFKIRTSRVSHVGVYLSDGRFVHSSCSQGVTISNLSDVYWTRYYAGAGRIVS